MSSCNLRAHFKILDAQKAEKMVHHSFKKEMPFQLVNGFIVVEMTVGNKKGNFILDTGAGTLINEDFAKDLSFKTLGKQKHRDVAGRKMLLKTVVFEKITVGAIDFQDIVASISDFQILKILKKGLCMDNISGLLGINVMNKGIWQIDYYNQKIIITDSRDSLTHPTDKQVINFYATGKGTPMIRMTHKDTYLGEAGLDTGNSGFIDIPKKTLQNLPFLKGFIKKYGISAGLFGMSRDTSLITQLPKLTLGQRLETQNAVVSFSSSLTGAPLIGYQFLKDYVVTIDWKYQEITFSGYKTSLEKPFFSYGFTPKMTDGKLTIASLIERSNADKAGFKLNDQILQINDVDCRNMTQTLYCDLRQQNIFESSSSLVLTIQRGDLVLKQELKKSDLMAEAMNE
jgi:hypothetical protein